MSTSIRFAELEQTLRRTPVIARVHPLVPLCLPKRTLVLTDSAEFLMTLDSPEIHDQTNVLLLDTRSPLASRFPSFDCLECPAIDQVNERLPDNLEYARQHMLTTTKVAKHISHEVASQLSDIVVFYLVDGLSYWDVRDWPFAIEPCFVDGPSVTFRYAAESKSRIVETIGFPAIIGHPSLAERLYSLGYRHARGYSYWNRNNVVADYMFRGVPLERVHNFEMMVALLKEEPLKPLTFIQIVQEGLDGLAHHRRELRRIEIDTAIEKIRFDVSLLLDFLSTTGYSIALYVMADHGILWRTEHEFQLVSHPGPSRPRYAKASLGQTVSEYATRFNQGEVQYDVFHYPFLGAALPSNDSGVHGGLSVQESVVPLIKIRG